MPTGLAQPTHLNNIVAAMQNVEANWMALSAQQRTETIANAVTAALRALFVPVPTLQVGNLGAGLNGQFDFGPWVLKVNTSMAIGNVHQTAAQRKEVIAKLGDVITHEARHCEQWWRMARLIVAEMRSKGMLATAQVLAGKVRGVAQNVLNQAVGAPPLTPPETQETIAWYASVYGSGSSFRAINAYGRNLRPTGGTFAEVGNQFQNSEFARYQRGLAEEEDAHQVGREVQRLFLQGSGIAPQGLVGHRPIAQGVTNY
jgi:hypothetical protein